MTRAEYAHIQAKAEERRANARAVVEKCVEICERERDVLYRGDAFGVQARVINRIQGAIRALLVAE